MCVPSISPMTVLLHFPNKRKETGMNVVLRVVSCVIPLEYIVNAFPGLFMFLFPIFDKLPLHKL